MTEHPPNRTCDCPDCQKYWADDLPPQKPGQARMLTVCEGSGYTSAEIGHWFSPDAVREMLERARL